MKTDMCVICPWSPVSIYNCNSVWETNRVNSKPENMEGKHEVIGTTETWWNETDDLNPGWAMNLINQSIDLSIN